MRKTPLAAFAAALGAVAPGARAAVISISSNQERSPEYLVSGGGTGHLQGTVTGSASAAGGPLFPDDRPAVILPSVRLEPLDGAAGVLRACPPDLPGAGGRRDQVRRRGRPRGGPGRRFGVQGVARLTFQQGTGPTGGYTPATVFTGTLTTVEAANVPEPASFALIGLGLAGVAAGRRGTAGAVSISLGS